MISGATLVDVAKKIATEEVQRLGVHVSPYVIGRIVEVTRLILAGEAIPDYAAADTVIELDGEEIEDADIVEDAA